MSAHVVNIKLGQWNSGSICNRSPSEKTQIAWIQRHLPSFQKIEQLAFPIFKHATFTAISLVSPFLNLSIAYLGPVILFSLKKKAFHEVLKVANSNSYSAETYLHAFKRAQLTCQLGTYCAEFRLIGTVKIIALSILFPSVVSAASVPFFVTLATAFVAFNLFSLIVAKQQEQFFENITKTLDGMFEANCFRSQLAYDQKTLNALYHTEHSNQLLSIEEAQKGMRTIYLKEKLEYLFLSAQTLLAKGHDADSCDFYGPLCRLAVAKELEGEVCYDLETCAPSLRIHLEKIQNAKEIYKTLSSKEKVLLQEVLISEKRENILKDLTPESQETLNGLYKTIEGIAYPMPQQFTSLIQEAIFSATGYDYLKSLALFSFASHQLERIKGKVHKAIQALFFEVPIC